MAIEGRTDSEDLLVQALKVMVKRNFFKVDQNGYWRAICADAKELGWDPMRVHEKYRIILGEVVAEIFAPPPSQKSPKVDEGKDKPPILGRAFEF